MKNHFIPALSVLFAALAFRSAQAVESIAHPWQLNFQAPLSQVMERLVSMHNFLLVIITLICVLVLVLLAYICLRFNKKSNPVPSKTTHNVKLEVIWTVIPILILVAIAIPSLRLHYFMEDDVEAEMTIKVVGYQWYWHYDYPDHGGFGFDSYMKKKEDLLPGEHRLLAVDNHLVVPVDTKVRLHITAGDVIHAWALPALGVKRDAVPGRLNTSWFKATQTGTFYGQCSELCGVGHGFMPIRVDVVSREEFDAWILAKQQEAGIDPASVTPSELQKISTPVTRPVSSEHDNPDKIMEKEKSLSAPGAQDSRPEKTGAGGDFIGNQNQPKPAKAEQQVEKDLKNNGGSDSANDQ